MNDEDELYPLLFEWATCKPDPGAYKPYSPELDPVNTYVEVKIPSQYVKRTAEDKIIISPMGMAYALEKLTSAIRRVQIGDSENEGNH